jgi:YfiH family protein
VAAAHAGWRGLASGVLEAALERFRAEPAEILAWLGPAIGPDAFEVGDEVRAAFLADDPGAGTAFRASRPGHWLADLYGLARRRLARRGIRAIYGGGFCTYSDAERFYSFRREPVTGRMASLIWIE